MPKTSKLKYEKVDNTLLHAEIRKKITSPYHLTQLQALGRRWGRITVQEVCWRLIIEGIEREREFMEQRQTG